MCLISVNDNTFSQYFRTDLWWRGAKLYCNVCLDHDLLSCAIPGVCMSAFIVL